MKKSAIVFLLLFVLQHAFASRNNLCFSSNINLNKLSITSRDTLILDSNLSGLTLNSRAVPAKVINFKNDDSLNKYNEKIGGEYNNDAPYHINSYNVVPQLSPGISLLRIQIPRFSILPLRQP